ncbi:MAG: response regulator [Chloroflexi bacterium]|nr:MAG: response regulator [Chloroflexota bacterium]
MTQRILIVDDDPNILAVLKVGVRTRYPGCSVTAVSNGFSALERLQNMRQDGHIALMLTDLQMPGLTGLQLAKIVKDNWPAVPIVLMTGSHDTDRIQQQADALQLEGFLTKPFTLKSLDKFLTPHLKPATQISVEGK